jgi:hypothetical protein
VSYVGYIPLVKQFIHQLPQDRAPSLLEVGIDRGTTLIPLIAFLARSRQQFLVVGVDVMVQEQVQLVLNNLDLQQGQQAFCMQQNSLEALPKMVEQGMRFDVLLLDGDHNYHTVNQEVQHVEALTHPHSLVVIDDYDGRWSERDLWYAEREGYEKVDQVTKPVQTEKHGVKVAVDEWLAEHPAWQKAQPLKGEPIMLMRRH